MKALFLGLLLAFSLVLTTQAQDAAKPVYEYQVVTTIESVVPGGLGRSRMISNDVNGKVEEVELKNFFSLVGINFGNVQQNDRTITTKINDLSNAGWELYQTTSGVYSAETSTGIFITRYIFRKPKK